MKSIIIIALIVLFCSATAFSKKLIFEERFIEESLPKCVTTASGTFAPKEPIHKHKLIFNENFDKFNLDIWKHELSLGGGGNWEFQWYANNRSNSYVEDGILNIRPTLVTDVFGKDFLTTSNINLHGGTPSTECTNPAFYGCERSGKPDNILNPIVSARISTVNSFNFKYGIVEVRAKLSSGDWLTPAIWFFPKNMQYGQWPGSGVMAMAEGKSNSKLMQNGINIGVERVQHGLGYGPYSRADGLGVKNEQWAVQNKNGWDSDFHRYQMEWTPEGITFSIDDIVTEKVYPCEGFWKRGGFDKTFPGVESTYRTGTNMAPFDEEFFLIINLSVGGILNFPDNTENPNGKPWKNTSPKAASDFWEGRDQWLPTWDLTNRTKTALQVDYVRVWSV